MTRSSGAFLRSMVAAGCWPPAKLTTEVSARIGSSRRIRVRKVIGILCLSIGGADHGVLTLGSAKKSAPSETRLYGVGTAADDAHDCVDEVAPRESFEDVIVPPCRERCRLHPFVVDAADEDNFRRRHSCANRRGRLDTVQVWQVDVHDNHV